MTGLHPRNLPPRDERAHPVVQDAIDKGYMNTDRNYVVRGFDSWDSANEGRRSIYRATTHLGVSCSSRTNEDIYEDDDGTFYLHFRLYSKSHGRAQIAKVYGGNPANLPYNPFAKKSQRTVDDYGRRI